MPRLRRTETLETADMQDVGTVYILTTRNRSMSKIGMTRSGTPEARARSYTDDHELRWTVVYSCETRDVAEVEQLAHARLAAHRSNLPGTREIFNVAPEIAQQTLISLLRPVTTEPNAGTARPTWLDYGKVLVATASTELVRVATAHIRQHRYGRQVFACWSVLMRVLSWWQASRRRQTFTK
jgi:hypothetical protein